MVDIVVPKPRIDQLFASPSDDGRMFPITYSEAKKENTLGLTFAGDSKAAPASVRFYNPGAIAARTSDAGHKLLGAVETSDLPGSNGKPLPTAAFDSPEDGIAYYGYFIQARVGDKPTINKIMTAYATGHPKSYKKYIKGRTGLDADKELDDDQLASVARAMFEWESGGAADPYSLNAQANRRMMEGIDNDDIKTQISRGRTAYKEQKDPGIPASDPIGAVILANADVSPNDNTSSNDSIGQQMASMASSQQDSRTLSEVMLPPTPSRRPSATVMLPPTPSPRLPATLDIDTSPEATRRQFEEIPLRRPPMDMTPPPMDIWPTLTPITLGSSPALATSPNFSLSQAIHAQLTGQTHLLGTSAYDPGAMFKLTN